MKMKYWFYLLSACFALASPAMELNLDTEQSHVVAIAKATGHQFNAEPDKFDCNLAVSEDGVIQAATFSFNFADLKTGKPKRDKEMLHWLDVESFPSLQFQMTGLKREGEQQIMVGTLSFHGNTQEMSFPVTVTKEEGRFHITGDTSLDVTDFGLKKIRKMLMLTVDTRLEIHFDLIGEAA